MAFSDDYNQYERWAQFHFYVSGGSTGVITETTSLSKQWKIKEVKVHCSSVFLSSEDLTVYFNSPYGSEYNFKLLSESLSGLTDLWATFEKPLLLASGVELTVNISLASLVNVLGIELVGWSVQG